MYQYIFVCMFVYRSMLLKIHTHHPLPSVYENWGFKRFCRLKKLRREKQVCLSLSLFLLPFTSLRSTRADNKIFF